MARLRFATIPAFVIRDAKSRPQESDPRAIPASGGKRVASNGKSAEKFIDGNFEVTIGSRGDRKQKFQSSTLHMEFMLLHYMPEARDAAPQTAGPYCQGRYEVQILDSFGLKGENNDIGTTKRRNPMSTCASRHWHGGAYDIDFTAAKYDASGKKIDNARMANSNGVLIHEDVPVPKSTRPRRSRSRPNLPARPQKPRFQIQNVWISGKVTVTASRKLILKSPRRSSFRSRPWIALAARPPPDQICKRYLCWWRPAFAFVTGALVRPIYQVVISVPTSDRDRFRAGTATAVETSLVAWWPDLVSASAPWR